MERNKKPFKEQSSIKDGFMEYSKSYSSILPSPAILESYEELHPGFIERLLDMVKAEQNNRLKIEERKLRNACIVAKFKQFIHLLIALSIIYVTFLLSAEHWFLSGLLCVSGFASLLLINTKWFNNLCTSHVRYKSPTAKGQDFKSKSFHYRKRNIRYNNHNKKKTAPPATR